MWTLVNFKMDKKASRIRNLSTCNLERFADQGTSNRIDSISKTSYQTDHKMHIFFLTRFQSLDEENLIVHTVHVFMIVWCAYAHGSASKDSAFCVDLCHQLHAYHVFCVLHAWTRALIWICVLTRPGKREPQWPHTYWAGQGESSWVRRTPGFSHLLWHYTELSLLQSLFFGWQLTTFTEMVQTCFESFSVHKNSFAFDSRSIP